MRYSLRKKHYPWFLKLFSFVSGGLLWQYFGFGGLLPVPSEIFSSLWHELYSGDMMSHLSSSLYRFCIGLVFGWILGVVVGISIVLSNSLFCILIPWLVLLFPVPKIALFPFFIIWLGIGEEARITTIGLGVFMPSVVCAWLGARAVPSSFLTLGKCYLLSRRLVIQYIYFPSMLPYLFLSLRLAVILGLILLVTSEMLGAEFGLGAFVLASGSMGILDKLFAGVLLISVVGILCITILGILEQQVVHWQKGSRFIE